MSNQPTSGVIDSQTRSRRSSWVTAILGVLAIIILEVSFSHSTLTAPMPGTVDMADMTWVEIRSAIENGYTVAIVPTGGIEQNGPQMVLGKHDYIVRSAADRVAHELGHALVTPVLSFVPQGNYDPPSDNMLFPGTLGVPEPVSAISKNAFDEREQSSRPAQQVNSAITVLNIGGMDDDVQQKAQRVDQDVPLATLDLLARVVARRIEPSPPFCAPFAVCESMIATVGLA